MKLSVVLLALFIFLSPASAQSLEKVLDNIKADSLSRTDIEDERDIWFSSEIDALKLGAIKNETALTYRVILHLWHANIGALSLSCKQEECELNIRRTDGYGTYSVGKLVEEQTYSISRNEAQKILPHQDQLASMPEQINPFQFGLCLHAPSFLIESLDGVAPVRRFRHCKEGMWSEYLETACPLIEYAWSVDPQNMKGIDPNRMCPNFTDQFSKEAQ